METNKVELWYQVNVVTSGDILFGGRCPVLPVLMLGAGYPDGYRGETLNGATAQQFGYSLVVPGSGGMRNSSVSK